MNNKKKKLLAILSGIMAAIMALGLLLGLLATTVKAASSSEIMNQINSLKGEKAELDAQMAELEKNLAANTQQMRDMINRKNGIDQQVALLHAQIINVNQTISAYNLMIADKQDELDKAESKLAALNEAYRERIRAMEEQGQISYWSVIFKAQSFADLLDRLNMISEIARADEKRLEQMRQVAEQVAAAREELAVQKVALEQSKLELQQTQLTLANKRTEADGLLMALIAKGDEYELEMEMSEDLQTDLMNQIAQAEKDYDAQKYKEWLATSVPPTTVKPTTNPAGTGNTSNGVTWYTPTKNYWISSPFGMRYHPISGKYTMHNGIDMAANQGTPIYATRAGIVTTAAYQAGGAGYYVNINHGDGFSSIYMHMTHYIVKKGDYVEAGQIIGYVGSTGGSTGPHLHFGIALNGVYVNPLNYIKA